MLRFFSLLLILGLSYSSAHSMDFTPAKDTLKTEGYLDLKGTVRGEDKRPLNDLLLLLTDSTGVEILDSIYTDEKGKYALQLEYQKKYQIYYTGGGGVTDIFLIIDTEVPESQVHKIRSFQFTITTLSNTESDPTRSIKPILMSTVEFDRRQRVFYQNLNGRAVGELIKEIDRSKKNRK
ncbi:hypothetical protein KFE98_15275 [bacterium SCSIO 12741]|nr:hypothetical protein KFE98_15275 [bacterium SCSIO 12741]